MAALPQIITSIVSALIGNIDKIIEAGIQLFVALIENLPAIIAGIVAAIPEIITSIVDAFGSFIGKMGEIGFNLIQGIWNGISDAADWLWEMISGFCGNIVDNIKNFFGIHSPSTLFRDLFGVNMVKGIGVGFDIETPNLQSDIEDDLSKVTAGLKATLDTESAKLNVNTGEFATGVSGGTVNVYNTYTSPEPLSPAALERIKKRERREIVRKLVPA